MNISATECVKEDFTNIWFLFSVSSTLFLVDFLPALINVSLLYRFNALLIDLENEQCDFEFFLLR